MDDIDIFQRTLKCKDIPLEEDEIEIFEVCSEEPSVEEEDTLEENELLDEPFLKADSEGLYNEFDCLKRRIQKLLLILQKKIGPCFEKPCPKIELSCCEELEICALQKRHHQLQQKIHELIQAFKAIRSEIHDLHAYICKQNKEIEELQNYVAFLQYWQNGLKKDEGVCHWRYVYIKDHKADWNEIKDFLKGERRCPAKLCEKYLPKSILKMNSVALQSELERLKALFVELFEMKAIDFDDHCNCLFKSPLKQIEIDFIENQIQRSKKNENKNCAVRFKCDKIDF